MWQRKAQIFLLAPSSRQTKYHGASKKEKTKIYLAITVSIAPEVPKKAWFISFLTVPSVNGAGYFSIFVETPLYPPKPWSIRVEDSSTQKSSEK
jgi:hypothetical protein